VARGDEVEAEGFPVVTAFRPGLSALDVKNLGAASDPQPVEFLPDQTRHSREQCELVTLEAEFLERTRTREAAVLVCRAGSQVFEASLADPDEPGADLVPGMKLRLAGICELLSTRPLVIPRNATGFRLLLRGPEDITIVARHPWWNTQRALWALGAVGILALAVGAWAVTLQAVVRSQSGVIRRQAQQQAVLEERERIARDLHDTLEQELVGVNMLLDSTAMHLNGAHPEAAEPLGLARRLLRRAREESRTTIRELRSVALEQRGLPAALEELLRPLAAAAGADFRMETRGTPVRMAGTQETHLLRIAHEAVANAARHSGGKAVALVLEYLPDQVRLTISDDGRGFDPQTASAEAGHFGLSGIRERTEKIGGALRLDTAPGQGCTVTVNAPVIPLSTSHMNPA
jgi:signal transduction histidine kinase